MSGIDWYQIAGEAWAKCDASLWGDDDGPDPTVVAAAALGPGLRAAVDAVLAAARVDHWRAGYDAAVEEMRGVVARTGSYAAKWAAEYLASQREYVERRVLDSSGAVEDAPESAPRPVEGGHVWSPPGDVQQCVNCHQTRGAYFATSARRPCPRPPSAQLPEERSDEKPSPMIDMGMEIVPSMVAPERSDEEPKNCPRCGSPRWVAVSLDEGWTRRAQCVPCGAYHPGIIGPGWQAQLRPVSGLPVDGETT